MNPDLFSAAPRSSLSRSGVVLRVPAVRSERFVASSKMHSQCANSVELASGIINDTAELKAVFFDSPQIRDLCNADCATHAPAPRPGAIYQQDG
ncbi:hypothetical protein TNCV_4949681 [Trichonephila clavipes]|nr:hypothetical protein TNCV_4949681 [Trichonephila clavipes]